MIKLMWGMTLLESCETNKWIQTKDMVALSKNLRLAVFEVDNKGNNTNNKKVEDIAFVISASIKSL